MDSAPIFITPEAVAEIFGVSLTWVYEKCRTRQRDPLPTLRIGRYIRFEKDAVVQWARSRGNTAAKKIAKAGVQ